MYMYMCDDDDDDGFEAAVGTQRPLAQGEAATSRQDLGSQAA